MFSNKNSLIYFFGTFANSLPQVLLLPLLSNYLTTDEFGLLSIFNASSAIIISFIAFNSVSYALVYFFKESESLNKNIKAINTLVLISFILIALIISMMHVLFDINFLQTHYLLIFFSLFHATIVTLINLRLSILQMQDKAFLFILLQLSISVAGLIISYILVKHYALGINGRIAGMILPSTFAFILVSIAFERKTFLSISYSYDDIIKIVRYGISFIQYKLLKQLRAHSDKLIIVLILGLSDAGIFAMALSISLPILLVNTAFDKIMSPRMILKLSNHENENIFRSIGPYFIFLLISLLVLSLVYYIVLLNIFSYFINEKYTLSLQIAHLIILGIIFQGINLFNTVVYAFYDKGFLLSKLSYLIFVIQLCISVALTNSYGIYGSAYAYMFSYFIGFAILTISLLIYQKSFTKQSKPNEN